MLPFQRTFISSYPKATQDTQRRITATTTDLGIWHNGKIGFVFGSFGKSENRA
jgi:hypothetical protein